jgi:hypothetical protein
MLSGTAKRLVIGLLAAGLWLLGMLSWLGQRIGEGSYERFIGWYLRQTFRVAVLSVVLGVCAIHWNWSRLQTNGRLSDSLLQDVVAERETRPSSGPEPSGTAGDGLDNHHRCFVPVGAGAAGLAPYLNPKSLASASAWIEPGFPWLGKDWWIVDVVDRRMVKMSRMDKAVLQPHPRMNAVQCVPANAMKLVNAGVNAQGIQEFQVMDLSRSAVY